jgi:hypothetical protein
MSYPVIAEIYSTFEGILMANAKRLVDDVAHKQGANASELWKIVKEKVKIGLMDVELPDPLPTYCSYPCTHSDGAIKTRCRAPCMLGFEACPEHINKHTSYTTNEATVDRIYDHEGIVYFVNEEGIALDRNGRPKGTVRNNVLYLFQKQPNGF